MAAVLDSFDSAVSRRRARIAPCLASRYREPLAAVVPDDPMLAAIDEWLGGASGTNPAAPFANPLASPLAGTDARQDP